MHCNTKVLQYPGIALVAGAALKTRPGSPSRLIVLAARVIIHLVIVIVVITIIITITTIVIIKFIITFRDRIKIRILPSYYTLANPKV